MIVRFRIRRDTAANWTASNPFLGLGEPGLETDTRKVKYGDGATAWNALAYSGAALSVALQAIDALTPATDRIAYFTGSATAALATLTGFGRSLMAAVDAAAARTALALGSLATKSTVNDADWSGADLEIANGGTGASSAAAARANLGLGTLATQSGTFSGTSSGTNTGDQTSVTGNAGTATALATGRTIAATGDITWTSPAFNGTANVTATATIGANVVTLAKMAQVATSTLLGRATAGTGNVEALTAAQGRTVLGLGTAATHSTGTSGATVPLLNTAVTWSGSQTLASVPFIFSGDVGFQGTAVNNGFIYRLATAGMAMYGAGTTSDVYIGNRNGTMAMQVDPNTTTCRFGGIVIPGADNTASLGSAANRWSQVHAGNGTITTSDEREKTDIGVIPDDWLDAWAAVEWSRFRFKKGDRWHIGLIAQRVHAAFDQRGIDAFEIGLLCHDTWESEWQPVVGKRGKPLKRLRRSRKAGDLWGLRYEECLAMEAALIRRALSRAGIPLI